MSINHEKKAFIPKCLLESTTSFANITHALLCSQIFMKLQLLQLLWSAITIATTKHVSREMKYDVYKTLLQIIGLLMAVPFTRNNALSHHAIT